MADDVTLDDQTGLGDLMTVARKLGGLDAQLLAEVYGQALQAAGFDVRFEIGLGPRELVQPALARGLIELVPEYAGTALRFTSLGASPPTDDLAATTSALGHVLRDRGLVVLAPAPAQDATAIVVTRALAARYALDRTVGSPPRSLVDGVAAPVPDGQTLLLERMAEQACADTWRNIRNDLKQIKLPQLSSPNETVWQVTEPGPDAANRLKRLKIKNPPPLLELA